MGLEKIISGGQTGADQGGLEAAKIAGLETGGIMPRGFRTTNGPNPELAELYGLTEDKYDNYQNRTKLNVERSDGTIILAIDMDSTGTLLTQKCANNAKKPILLIPVKKFPSPTVLHEEKMIQEAKKFIIDNNITVLNIAGNRESGNSGLQESVREFLVKVFTGLNEET